MKKLTLFTIFLLIIITTKSLASSCLNNLKLNKNIKIFNLNKFKSNEVIPGIDLIEVPVEFFCKQTKAQEIKIQLFFIDESLKRIIFLYEGKSDRPLFNVAQNFYKVGFKKNQNIIDMREKEQYLIKDKNIIYTYENTKGEGKNFKQIKEIFEIVDKTFEDFMLKFSLTEELK
tara:strand:+ start:4547 stop:5065 length:519 start_codon:yes stop_codon:yes gene_type:complete